MPLLIRVQEKHPASYMVVLKGSLDHDTTQHFEREIQKLLRFKPRRVVINMSGVDYVSTAGIHAIFKLRERMKEGGGDISFFVLQHQVKAILKAVKKAPLENIFYTEEEADIFLRALEDTGKRLRPKKTDSDPPDPNL